MNPLQAAAAAGAKTLLDAHPPLTAAQALVESERCYYCFDAPCVTACPTGIDVPSFIARITQGNLHGAAKTILQANPLGGMCARVCPTEVLCEQACVRHTNEDKPVEIGRLQRVATDTYFASVFDKPVVQPGARPGAHPVTKPAAPLFTRAADTGRCIAVVGAGPAGLACAHGLACHGHRVVLFDARPKLGGLNEYGIASYKTTGGFAQQEVRWLLSIGGIEVRSEQQLGRDITLDGLRADFDAVFLGLGLAGVNALGIDEPAAAGLRAAVDFIADLRQAKDLAQLATGIGRHVVVIGGGMTAVDAAVQARMLGAQTATIVYRRGAQAMAASEHEQDFAQTQGVAIRHWAAPLAVLTEDRPVGLSPHLDPNIRKIVTGVRFASTAMRDGKLVHTGEEFDLRADMVLRAIGQNYLPEAASSNPALRLKGGRIETDAFGRSSVPGVWAGGDCRYGGRDLTVEAVEHGKVAAQAMHAALTASVSASLTASPTATAPGA